MVLYGLHVTGRGINTDNFSVSSRRLFTKKELAEGFIPTYICLCEVNNLEKGTGTVSIREYEVDDDEIGDFCINYL